MPWYDLTGDCNEIDVWDYSFSFVDLTATDWITHSSQAGAITFPVSSWVAFVYRVCLWYSHPKFLSPEILSSIYSQKKLYCFAFLTCHALYMQPSSDNKYFLNIYCLGYHVKFYWQTIKKKRHSLVLSSWNIQPKTSWFIKYFFLFLEIS